MRTCNRPKRSEQPLTGEQMKLESWSLWWPSRLQLSRTILVLACCVPFGIAVTMLSPTRADPSPTISPRDQSRVKVPSTTISPQDQSRIKVPSQDTITELPLTDSFCSDYAIYAVEQYEMAMARPACRVPESGRWHGYYDPQYKWCLTVPHATANGERKAREDHLVACGALKRID